MTLWVAAIVLGIVAGGFLFLLRRLATPSSVTACDQAWLEEFSVAKYRPMLRLLAQEDYEFLSSQAGYKPDIAKKLRKERRRIFRAYLDNLVRDFHRLQLSAKMLVVNAEVDREDLVSKLMMQRLNFSLAVAMIEVRLALHTVGLATVDVRGLLGSLEAMRLQVDGLRPATELSLG